MVVSVNCCCGGGAGRGVCHAERLHGLGGCLGVFIELGDGGGVVVDVDERSGVVGDGRGLGCIVAGESDGDGCVVVGLEDFLGFGGADGRSVVDDGLGGRLGVGCGLGIGSLLGCRLSCGFNGIERDDCLAGVGLISLWLGGVCWGVRLRVSGVEGHHGLAGICIDSVQRDDRLAGVGDGLGFRCGLGRRLNGIERNDSLARINGGRLGGCGFGSLCLGGRRSLGCCLGRYGRSAIGAKARVVRQLRSALRAKHKVSSLLLGVS